jgi:phage terminase small subunit
MSAAIESAYSRLKRRQRRFVDEYLLGRKGTEAIKAIGFKGRRPDLAASKLLALPEVRAAVDERRAVLCEAVGLRQEMVVREMMAIGFSDVRQLFNEDGTLRPISELPDEAARAIAGVDVEDILTGRGKKLKRRSQMRKVKLWDKVKALSDLSRISGLDKADSGAGAIGPGLTVIVQQIVGASQVAAGPAAQHVVIDLPGPA